MSCHFLLQEIFPTQGLKPGLPHGRQTLHYLSHQGTHCILWDRWCSYLILQWMHPRLKKRNCVRSQRDLISSQPLPWDLSNIFLKDFSSVAQSCPTLCNPMDCSTPDILVHHKLPVYSNSCPSSRSCHPTVSSFVIPFSCLQSFPASGSFQ